MGPIAGGQIIAHAFRVVNGYAIGSQWANMAVLNNELELPDGASPVFNGEVLGDWDVDIEMRTDGRVASITLTAPASALFPRCE